MSTQFFGAVGWRQSVPLGWRVLWKQGEGLIPNRVQEEQLRRTARELLARRLEARFGLRLAEVVEDAKSAEDTNNLVAARAAHAHFTERTGAFELMPFVTDAVKQETMNHIRIFGSEGRA